MYIQRAIIFSNFRCDSKTPNAETRMYNGIKATIGCAGIGDLVRITPGNSEFSRERAVMQVIT